MKTLRKVLAAVLAISMIGASFTAVSFAADSDPYDKDGDFAVNGEFPETGKILDWGFYHRPAGMQNIWADLNSKEIAIDKYIWANDMSVNNSGFNFTINSKNAEGDAIWTGASTIKNGALKIDSYVYVPEVVNPDNEAYTELFSIWGIKPDGGWYNEQGCLYSIIMNDSDAYLGFLTSGHHDAVTSVDSDRGQIMKIETQKWYKLSAVINYDFKTLDYYVDDVYVCSHNDFAGNAVFYEMGALYCSKSGSPVNNKTHVYVTGVKAERKSTVINAAAEIIGGNTINIAFDQKVDSSDINDASFTIESSTGVSLPVESVSAGNSSALIKINGEIDSADAVRITCNNEIKSKERNIALLAAGTKFYAFAKNDAGELVNMDFENTVFPTSFAESKAFTDFYCEFQAQSGQTNNYQSDFINAKKYLDLNADAEIEAGYYLKYDYQQFSQIPEAEGDGKALSLHRNTSSAKANYWGSNGTYGLIIPFKNGRSVESGNVVIEFDSGKFGPQNINSDSYTFGLHDANNEITQYDLNNAWSNSTVLFGLGDYYETASLVYAPQGRAASYSYYYAKSNPEDKCLWPEDWSKVQQNNNMVRHYKIELNLDTKKYNLYLNDSLIGDSMTVPETPNEPKYDAFVIGVGMDKRDSMATTDAYLYLDNLKITRQEPEPLKVESITNSDKTPFNGMLNEDKKVVLNFNKAVASLSAKVGENSVTQSISGSEVTLSFESVPVNGNATLALSDITAADGTKINAVNILINAEIAKMDGYFSETPDGYCFELNDGGYAGDYKVCVGSFKTVNGTVAMVDVELFDKAEDGIYALSSEFEYSESLFGFVVDENFAPLADKIYRVE